MSKQLLLLAPGEPNRQDQTITRLPPQHREETDITGNQLREGDTVLVMRRGEERLLKVSSVKGGLFLAWPMNGDVRFYKNTCKGPNGWRIVRVLARAPERK